MEKKRVRRRITHDMPPLGTRLKSRTKGREEYAEVVEDAKAKSGIRILFRGKIYSSLSAAAREATGHSTNGWNFWRVG